MHAWQLLQWRSIDFRKRLSVKIGNKVAKLSESSLKSFRLMHELRQVEAELDPMEDTYLNSLYTFRRVAEGWKLDSQEWSYVLELPRYALVLVVLQRNTGSKCRVQGEIHDAIFSIIQSTRIEIIPTQLKHPLKLRYLYIRLRLQSQKLSAGIDPRECTTQRHSGVLGAIHRRLQQHPSVRGSNRSPLCSRKHKRIGLTSAKEAVAMRSSR